MWPEEPLLTEPHYRRAGRFGTKGLAITFVSSDDNEEVLKLIQSRFEVAITELPETIDASTYSTSPTLLRLTGSQISRARLLSERLGSSHLQNSTQLVVFHLRGLDMNTGAEDGGVPHCYFTSRLTTPAPGPLTLPSTLYIAKIEGCLRILFWATARWFGGEEGLDRLRGGARSAIGASLEQRPTHAMACQQHFGGGVVLATR